MSTVSFMKELGEKLLSNASQATPEAENLKAGELLAFIQKLGLQFKSLKVITRGSKVELLGDVEKQSDAEKIALAVGNVAGVDAVENNMKVATPEAESKYHTVVSGESLSKIAGKYYGDVQKYNIIFEANKPMLSDPDKIYPGQVLRIPAQQ